MASRKLPALCATIGTAALTMFAAVGAQGAAAGSVSSQAPNPGRSAKASQRSAHSQPLRVEAVQAKRLAPARRRAKRHTIRASAGCKRRHSHRRHNRGVAQRRRSRQARRDRQARRNQTPRDHQARRNHRGSGSSHSKLERHSTGDRRRSCHQPRSKIKGYHNSASPKHRRRRAASHALARHPAKSHRARGNRSGSHRAGKRRTTRSGEAHSGGIDHARRAHGRATLADYRLLAHIATPCPYATTRPTRASIEKVRVATLCLVNRQRLHHGLHILSPNPQMRLAAEQHSESMVQDGYFSHYGPSGDSPTTRLRAAGYIYSSNIGYEIAENIAWGTLSLATPKAIVEAWMASPEHRANILDGHYRDTGLGVAPGLPGSMGKGQPGAAYTQDFGVIIRP